MWRYLLSNWEHQLVLWTYHPVRKSILSDGHSIGRWEDTMKSFTFSSTSWKLSRPLSTTASRSMSDMSIILRPRRDLKTPTFLCSQLSSQRPIQSMLYLSQWPGSYADVFYQTGLDVLQSTATSVDLIDVCLPSLLPEGSSWSTFFQGPSNWVICCPISMCPCQRLPFTVITRMLKRPSPSISIHILFIS